MTRYKVVFVTHRSEFHQQRALDAAPTTLNVVMLRDPDRNTLEAELADADYLISERSGVIDAQLLGAAPRLKLIQRLGRLTHDIDLHAAAANGVQVAYLPIKSTVYVAEHIMMQMLMLAKRAKQVEQVTLAASDEWGERHRTDENTFRFNWSQQANILGLLGATVGIIGMGEIGIELAARLRGWDCHVLYHKRTLYPTSVEQSFRIAYATRDEVFRQSDFVVNLLPYTPQTYMSIGDAAFNSMKNGAVFVSAGSGSVIDEAALAGAVRSGKLHGAALDTYEYEPTHPENSLIALAWVGYNVLLTPHTAAVGDYGDRGGEYMNILRDIAGEPLQYLIGGTD